MTKIDVFDATDKSIYLIFDPNAEKILNKSIRDLAEKQTKLQLI